MKHLSLAGTAVAVITAAQSIGVSAQTSSPSYSEEITITAIREDRKSRGATGLDLSVFETPQSLTIIQAETIDSFGFSDINSLLKMTTGVNVDSTETDRTSYNARGFDITSMHIDGVGMPFGELIVGDLDTVIYESVEIIRGSNGLITGLGNPSGTINYVRKRPTNERTGSVKGSLGRWDNSRIEVDVSTPLTESGSWAARFVAAYQDKDSWLDHYANERQTAYLVVDGQINDRITLTVGASVHDNDSDGVLWGAAPVIYTDGTQANFDVSTTTAMDWTYWTTESQDAFVELGWVLSEDWKILATAQHTDYKEHSELFYVYWNTGLDRETGLGMYSYPGKYDVERDSLVLDINLQGHVDWWGREHSLQFGASSAESNSESYAHSALSGFTAMPAFPGWQGNEVLRPTWAAPYQSAHEKIQLDRLYASIQLAVSERVNVILGINKVDYKNDGESYGVSTDSRENGSTPYVGFTWALRDDLNFYASYSDIYQPQYVLGENLQSLGSAEGKSYELGVKHNLGNQGLLTVALFKTEQSNLQEFKEYGDGDGIDDTDYSDDFDYSIYRGINVESEGVEVEISGRLSESVEVQAGITHLTMEDENGDEARTFIPRNTAKVILTWQPQTLDKLKLGATMRWQDDTYFDSSYGRIEQDSYVLLGGYLSYRLNESVTLGLNLDNITDETYFSSVKYEQAWYAAPRSFSATAKWQF